MGLDRWEVTPESDEGPSAPTPTPQKCTQEKSLDCYRPSDVWQAEAFRRLQARATPLGLLVRQLWAEDAGPAFLVARVSASREFAGLDGAARFVSQWEGRHHG